ncbi:MULTISPECIES: hypothetical protein [unclassified Halomonas]|uniref:hypothetical protein n=1 Tax=unclassified Halomonas TaxID=2609666 RepID=UPI0028863AEB|nr:MULTISPECIES: hypothetical protein [unclassified Halomonas]MDT0501913.1 hypothetical protein [Halomonas sp. PAR7]MDT0510998.1 hypothetical protein [Halomonas sp. LES1]MDT0592485.1 hypothetical protein [Halomonas sp. PAR8]
MTRLRLLAAVLVLATTATAGWLARGWLEDSQRLTAERAIEQAIAAAMARESEIAGAVEARLAELEANERIIDRGVIREIEKPIYRRVCLEPRLVRLLNDAAAGRAPASADVADALPNDAATAD